MAKAASKKAAAARSSASKFYLPLLLGLNALYLALRYARFGLEASWWEMLAVLLFVGLHYAAYVNILEQAATRSSSDKSLVGGVWLDVLAVVLFIQFASLISSFFYWFLLLLPVWGGWTLYQTFAGKGSLLGSAMAGGDGGGSSATNPSTSESGVPAGNRRQRRAENRGKRRGANY